MAQVGDKKATQVILSTNTPGPGPVHPLGHFATGEVTNDLWDSATITTNHSYLPISFQGSSDNTFAAMQFLSFRHPGCMVLGPLAVCEG